jgi:GNAT superfamily N-acetyltransferase
MQIIIRRAVAEDCERILELVQELADYEKAPNEVTVSLEHFRESGFGKNPVWWAFVAEISPSDQKNEIISPKIIGFALYYIRFSTWKGKTLYLEDILVTKSMRRQNIGTKLFDQIIQEASEKGFQRISWQVLYWNESAIRFYKKYNAAFDDEWINGSINL